MYVIMFVPRPFTVHNAFPCFHGRNKVIYIYIYIYIYAECCLHCAYKNYHNLCTHIYLIYLYDEAHCVPNVVFKIKNTTMCVYWCLPDG